jgi:hypothetical protein
MNRRHHSLEDTLIVDNDMDVYEEEVSTGRAPARRPAGGKRGNRRPTSDNDDEGDDEKKEEARRRARIAAAEAAAAEAAALQERRRKHQARQDALLVMLELQRQRAVEARVEARRTLTAHHRTDADDPPLKRTPRSLRWRSSRGETDDDGVGGEVTGGGWHYKGAAGAGFEYGDDPSAEWSEDDVDDFEDEDEAYGAHGAAREFRDLRRAVAGVNHDWLAVARRASDRAWIGGDESCATVATRGRLAAALGAHEGGALRALLLASDDATASSPQEMPVACLRAAGKAVRRLALPRDEPMLATIRGLRVMRLDVGAPLLALLAVAPLCRAFAPPLAAAAGGTFHGLVTLELNGWLSVQDRGFALHPPPAGQTNNVKREEQQHHGSHRRPAGTKTSPRARAAAAAAATAAAEAAALSSYFTRANFPSLTVLSVTLAAGSNCPLDLLGPADHHDDAGAPVPPPPPIVRLRVTGHWAPQHVRPGGWPAGEPFMVSMRTLAALSGTLRDVWPSQVAVVAKPPPPPPPPPPQQSQQQLLLSPPKSGGRGAAADSNNNEPRPASSSSNAIWWKRAPRPRLSPAAAAPAAPAGPPPLPTDSAPLERCSQALSAATRLSALHFDSCYDWHPLPCAPPTPATETAWRRQWLRAGRVLLPPLGASLLTLSIEAWGGPSPPPASAGGGAARPPPRRVCLPDSISVLQALTSLSVRCDRLVSVSSAIGALRALKRLVLESNDFGPEQAAPATAAAAMAAAGQGAAAAAGGGQPPNQAAPPPAAPQAAPPPAVPPPQPPLRGRDLARLSDLRYLRLSHMRPSHAHVVAHRLPQLRTLVLWLKWQDNCPPIVMRAARNRLIRSEAEASAARRGERQHGEGERQSLPRLAVFSVSGWPGVDDNGPMYESDDSLFELISEQMPQDEDDEDDDDVGAAADMTGDFAEAWPEEQEEVEVE